MEIYTAKDVCKTLNISHRKLSYWLDKIGDVERTSGNMRVFTNEDIERIKKKLGGNNEKNKSR